MVKCDSLPCFVHSTENVLAVILVNDFKQFNRPFPLFNLVLKLALSILLMHFKSCINDFLLPYLTDALVDKQLEFR